MELNLNLCICQLIKDEHNYIEEWIEYHHNLGINRFYLIEDITSKSHKELLQKYDYVEVYRLLDLIDAQEEFMLNNTYRQYIVYRMFCRLWRGDNDWLFFIDPDEYIEITKERLYNILYDCKNQPAIPMRWKNMECNDHIYHPNNHEKYSLLNTYTNYNFKIYNHKLIINCNVYCKDLDCKYWNPYLFPHKFTPKIKYYHKHQIFLKHFLCKSFEEWVDRLTIKGEIKTAKWNRKFNDWFKTNPKYKYMKKQLYEEFDIKNKKVKKNDYPVYQ